MNTSARCVVTINLAFATGCSWASAEMLIGRVTAVGRDVVLINVEGEWLPGGGDRGVICCEIPGLDVPAIAAEGYVTGTGEEVSLKPSKTFTTIKPGFVVRFDSAHPLKRGAAKSATAGVPGAGRGERDPDSVVLRAYARESAYLAALGGGAGDGGANPVNESEHFRFAAGASSQELMANLVSNYTAQFDRQLAMDVVRAREFYAEASARLAAYEIDLGDPGSNLKNKGPHLVWAERHDASRMRQAIAEKVAALLRGAGSSVPGGSGDQPVAGAAPGPRLPDSVAKPGHVDRIPSPDQSKVMFYVFQPGQSARFGVAKPDGVILWEKNAGIRPLVSYYWSEDSGRVVFLTECMQQESELHCPKDVTSTWVFVLDAATGAVVGDGDLDRQVLDLKSRLPDALEASHSIESLRLADGWLEVTIGHRGQRVSGRCALADLAPGPRPPR